VINSVSSQIGSIPSVYNIADNSSKIEVPVPSSVSVYAQFKYVRGVPASSGQNPVSLSRAQIIDSMVSYLNNSPDKYELDKREDFTLQELGQEVHKVVNDSKPAFHSMPGISMDTGLIFNLSA